MIPWAVACQAPLSMGFPRQEYWSRLPFSFSRGSSLPRDWTCTSCGGRRVLYRWAPRAAPENSTREHLERSWWVTIQIIQPLLPVLWLQRLHLEGNSFRKFRSLCCFTGSAVWGCCANMCVYLSISAINTVSPCSRFSLISLRNKGWKDFFRS